MFIYKYTYIYIRIHIYTHIYLNSANMQKIVTSLNVTIRLNQIGINDSELLNNFETNNDNIIILCIA